MRPAETVPMEPLSDNEMAGPSTTRQLPDQGPEEEEGAPRFRIAPRVLAAVEIPAVVENIDRTVKAFGRVPTLAHVSSINETAQLDNGADVERPLTL